MIKQLELKNFKSIKNHKFPLRNLNLVLGLNGMGKSTFIQSLLLLRQSRNLNYGELQLKGDHVDIGKAKDAFYQFSKDENMIFDIHFESSKQKFEFVYKAEADYFRTKEEIKLNQTFFEESIFNFDFQYLSANRIDPNHVHQRSYTAVVDRKNIGDRGEFTVDFLNCHGNSEIAFFNLKHPKANTSRLIEQVNAWMGEISPGVKLNITEVPNSDFILLDLQFEQPTLGFTNRFKPTNVGFGISYALPVVVALLASRPGELIIIENPESHIHPRGQAELGKLIALTAMNDVQIIIESHSDHILNGIRVATKEKMLSEKKEIIFYFEKKIEPNEQYSNITNIELDRNGELSEYPKDLLDEWSNQLLKLV